MQYIIVDALPANPDLKEKNNTRIVSNWIIFYEKTSLFFQLIGIEEL